MKAYDLNSTNNTNLKKRYYVKGMHCNSCNLLIEKNIKNSFDVNCVEAHYKKNLVEIEADKKNLPTIYQLNNIFKKHGYTFFENENSNLPVKTNITTPLFIIGAFVALFLLLKKFNINTSIDLNSGSIFTNYFIFGLIAGISSCAALVGSMILSLSKSWM